MTQWQNDHLVTSQAECSIAVARLRVSCQRVRIQDCHSITKLSYRMYMQYTTICSHLLYVAGEVVQVRFSHAAMATKYAQLLTMARGAPSTSVAFAGREISELATHFASSQKRHEVCADRR